jgi:hypothetical protein
MDKALVRMPQRTLALPEGDELRVLALFDGVALQHVNPDGAISATVAVSEPIALARLLRHGGNARTLSYQGDPVPIAVCRDGDDGYLLARGVCVPLPKTIALEAALTLDPAPNHLAPEAPGAYPFARAYGLHETATIYVADHERYVVSLVVGYSHSSDEVESPLGAARAALELTTEPGCDSTNWFVYDRETERMHLFEQRDLEHGHDQPELTS